MTHTATRTNPHRVSPRRPAPRRAALSPARRRRQPSDFSDAVVAAYIHEISARSAEAPRSST